MRLIDLARKSKQLFPTSKHHRKQWMQKTLYLYQSGKHQLLTGKMPNNTRTRFEHLIQY